MKIRKEIQAVEWGIGPLDQVTHGIPKSDMSVIETPDYHSGMLVLGHYMHAGLQKGERCAFITFESVTTFLENFLLWNMDFEKYLQNEQLVLLRYQPNFTFEVGLSHQYESVFQEVARLSGGLPERIAIQQIDTMINLNNLTLMNSSAMKLASAAKNEVTSKTTILGQFVQFSDRTHKDLRIAFQKTLSAYFTLKHSNSGVSSGYNFSTEKLPWYRYAREKLELELKEGAGIVSKEVRNHVKVA